MEAGSAVEKRKKRRKVHTAQKTSDGRSLKGFRAKNLAMCGTLWQHRAGWEGGGRQLLQVLRKGKGLRCLKKRPL